MDIRFTYEGQEYRVPKEAYDLSRIVLPDGTVLQVGRWLETDPPQPAGLSIVNHLFWELSVDEIADKMNAVKAESVR